MSIPSRGALASYGKDVECILLRFWPNGTSQTTLTRVDEVADATAGGFIDFGGGVASVKRTANTGEFTVTLEKGYTRLAGVYGEVCISGPDGTYDVKPGAISNEGTVASALSFLVKIFRRTETALSLGSWAALDLNGLSPDAQQDIVATVSTITAIDLNSLPADAEKDIVDVGTTTTVDAELIETNDSTIATQANAMLLELPQTALVDANDATIATEVNNARTALGSATTSATTGTDISAATTSCVFLMIFAQLSKVPR